jgi:hypothetical protein
MEPVVQKPHVASEGDLGRCEAMVIAVDTSAKKIYVYMSRILQCYENFHWWLQQTHRTKVVIGSSAHRVCFWKYTVFLALHLGHLNSLDIAIGGSTRRVRHFVSTACTSFCATCRGVSNEEEVAEQS